MGGKRRRRAASSGDAGHVAETPGTYRVSSSADSAAERDAAVNLFPAAGRLSVNEREAIGWGLTGKKNNEIATISGKSKRTIEKQMASALAKLGVDDREAALVMFHHLEVLRLLGRIAYLERELAVGDERIKVLQRQLRRQQ
jgi:DNA-binding CsgD family transcriptional regulator